MKSIKCRSWLFLGAVIASEVLAERYSVTDDSFGGYSAKPVEEVPSNENKRSIDDVVIEQKQTFPREKSDIQPNVNRTPTNTKGAPSLGNVTSDEVDQSDQESVSSAKSQVSPDPSVQRELSVFEKVYYESERKAKAEVIERLTTKEGEQSVLGSYDATQVDPVDFVDGDILEQTGAREEVEKAPYFITVDENGIPQNTFYDPVLVSAALDKQRNKTLEYTEAKTYEEYAQEVEGELNLPDGADPVAAGILSSGEKEFDLYFEAFAKKCCEHLPNIVTPTVEMGRPRAYQLTNDDLYYRFEDGDSRFLLVSLPTETNENYPLRIRTFIRTFKKLSIDHGVFFPQIITLNAEKKPVRIMTGPLLRYSAETWSMHGYLEGVFEIDRSEQKDEHYVLINTTRDVLRQSSVIDSEEPIEIAHMSVGSFEIEAILQE